MGGKYKQWKRNSFRVPLAARWLYLNFTVYQNGTPIGTFLYRKPSITYCQQHDKPDTVFHIRCANKLVYFQEHGHEPMFFNGFEVGNYFRKPYRRTITDRENHTPKETTERYEAIAHALEQTAQSNGTTQG